MGVTIRGDFKGSPSYDMGYMTFNLLRMDIAHTVSDEFGFHYDQMPMACAGVIDVKTYNIKTEALIRKYHCKERFLDFLYQQDIHGKLSPYKCKALHDGILALDSGRLYGYTAYPDRCMTIDNFRDLLQDCFTRKKYLVWS